MEVLISYDPLLYGSEGIFGPGEKIHRGLDWLQTHQTIWLPVSRDLQGGSQSAHDWPLGFWSCPKQQQVSRLPVVALPQTQ